MRRRKIRVLARKEDAGQGPNFEGSDFIPGPKLAAKFGIRDLTLWHWRPDKENCPPFFGECLSPAGLRRQLVRPATAWPERTVGRKASRRRRRANGRSNPLASRPRSRTSHRTHGREAAGPRPEAC